VLLERDIAEYYRHVAEALRKMDVFYGGWLRVG
jgi:hypothetical protein